MIKIFESFDHLGMADDGTESNRTSYLWNLGWRFGTGQYYDPSWAPYYTGGEVNPLILDGRGRFGSRALSFVGGSIIYPPIIERKCNALVVGMCVAEATLNEWYDTNYYWYPGPVINVAFLYGEHQNFRVRLTFNKAGYVAVQCYTGTDDGSGTQNYPVISTPEYIPCPYFLTEFTFIEVYLDVTDFMNGRVKVAINNRTYVDKSGIATAAYQVFGSDPYDDRAKLNRITIKSEQVGYLYDTFYLCDDQGGYQNDFLGDVFMKTCYPVADGVKSDWMAVENSTVVDAEGQHHEFVDDDPIYPGDEQTYLEADQDMSQELLSFETDPIPPESTLIAVNSRTLVRNVASPGVPRYNTIVPLYQIQGNPIAATNSLAKRVLDWNYYFLDVYYPLVPGFATPWAEYLLEQSQFGFQLRTLENAQKLLEEFLWADWNTTRYDWDETIAESLGLLDDSTESTWDVTIEDGLCTTEEPDDGNFLLGEAFGFVDDLLGTAEGLRNICTGGTATASSDNGSEPAGNAFDGDFDTKWSSAWWTMTPWWLAYELADGIQQAPIEYVLVHNGYYKPMDWQFQVAKEGGIWETLDTQSGITLTGGGVADRFPLPGWNPNETYHKFRLYITACADGVYYSADLAELKIMIPWTEDLT